jgi:hypothetical protein
LIFSFRIEADVEVVEMNDSDISEYTYERTLIMEQRNEMLKEMKVSEKRSKKMVRLVSKSTPHICAIVYSNIVGNLNPLATANLIRPITNPDRLQCCSSASCETQPRELGSFPRSRVMSHLYLSGRAGTEKFKIAAYICFPHLSSPW